MAAARARADVSLGSTAIRSDGPLAGLELADLQAWDADQHRDPERLGPER
jgi:hypothetical protein